VDKAPLYAGFVVAVSWLAGGYHPWAVQAAQCSLAAGACLLSYALFRRTLGADLARWAGLACALYPTLIWYTPRLWTETLLTFILAALSLSLVALLQGPTGRRAALCGALAGLAALTKGAALVFVALVPLALLLRFRVGAWRWLLLFVLVSAVLIAPWIWRDWLLTGQLVPIHTGSGFNLYLGNGFARHWLEAPLSYARLKALTELDMPAALGTPLPVDPLALDRSLGRVALAEMQAQPLLVLRKLAVQSLTLWTLAADPAKSILTGIAQLPVVALAVYGAGRALRRQTWALVLLVPVAGVAGVSLAVFAFARLAVPIMPYLIGLAVYGLWPTGDSGP